MSSPILRAAARAASILAAAAALGACALGGGIAPRRYCAVYGVRDYAEAKDTYFADADALALRELLLAQGYAECAYGVDAAATKSAMLADIASAAEIVGEDEEAQFLFFFSGHGLSIEWDSGAEEYIAPVDARFEGGSVVADSLISTKELSEALSRLRCRNVIVILDTCYSGGFADPGSAIDTAPQDYGPYDGGTESSTALAAIGRFGELLAANAAERDATPPIAITAAGSEELSWESGGFGHGVFTYFLLEAAAKGDGNGDGYVTATEAYAYTASKIKSEWNSASYSKDFLPRISGGARDLVLFAGK